MIIHHEINMGILVAYNSTWKASGEPKNAASYVIDEWADDDEAMQVNTAFQADADDSDDKP